MAKSAKSSHNTVRKYLSGGTIVRQAELIESVPTPNDRVRKQIDGLVVSGEIERFVVGNHIMLRPTDELNTSGLVPSDSTLSVPLR